MNILLGIIGFTVAMIATFVVTALAIAKYTTTKIIFIFKKE